MDAFSAEEQNAEDRPIVPLNVTAIRNEADVAAACDALTETCDEVRSQHNACCLPTYVASEAPLTGLAT